MCLFCTTPFMLPLATPIDAKPGFHPVIIRGTGTTDSAELQLAYQATFPNGSLQASVDQLGAGAMQPGDTLIPNSNPTFAALPGEIMIGITRPADLSPDLIVAQSVWATPVNFGPSSVSRISATFRAPVGPIPSGGFAIGIVAKTGGKDDLADDTRIAVTINVRPGFLVRLNVPFGAVETTNTVLSQKIKDDIFGSPGKPFTLEMTVDRVHGTGTAKLIVGDHVVSLPFTLSDFLADSGPVITAMGAGIAVNANGPGQTASVHVRDFRIYANVGG
jgi:hypothetical protein